MRPITAEWVDKAEGDFATVEYLSEFAVSFRYPGESADRESALDARRRCRIFRRAALVALGLPT
jgi:hypothetical protein